MLAVLNYEDYDRLPIVHFGFWNETVQKWVDQGVLTEDFLEGDFHNKTAEKAGFDCGWNCAYHSTTRMNPPFEHKLLEELPDGSRKVQNNEGVIVLEMPGVRSIPAEIDHIFKGRAEWEEQFKPRFEYDEESLLETRVCTPEGHPKLREGGLDYLRSEPEGEPRGLFCGSIIGKIRNFVGMENLSYLYVDDEELYTEMIDTLADNAYRTLKFLFDNGAKFDYGHFWEDICFKSGPLVSPSVFEEKCGPRYRDITDLLSENGIDLVSVDCDGKIDALIPTWLENGVNIMFPIEVGTWDASIEPWREKYGRELRGVGGMKKHCFAEDKAAIDREIERLAKLVDLGGFIPCPDHRIAPDAEWDLVCYYCERMREFFG